jgi:site-specific DNA-methyltransferase (adenine-specific)
VATNDNQRALGRRYANGTGEDTWAVVHGDSFTVLADLAPETVDAVVCDPPYGIDFNGEHWDGPTIRRAVAQPGRKLTQGQAFQVWSGRWASECLRAMRPGAHLAAFAAPRTAHRLACALEDNGFELRDTLMWLYGTGMPKSRRLPGGQGLSLKPAYEPIVLARKPPELPVERNIARHRTGALNTDACRVNRRYPANVLLAHHPQCTPVACRPTCPTTVIGHSRRPGGPLVDASRVFYCPKAGRSERDAGCEQLPRRPLDLFPQAVRRGRRPPAAANAHPTVKPLAVMRWLVRLVTPLDGLVLDPFCGSGSTGAAAILEGRRFLGIEREPDYVTIARARINHWAEHQADPSRDMPA